MNANENFVTMDKSHMPESLALWINQTWSVVGMDESFVLMQELYDTYEAWCEDNSKEPTDFDTFKSHIAECEQVLYQKARKKYSPIMVYGYSVEDTRSFTPQ